MSHYRAGNLPNVQRVKVTVKQPPVVVKRSTNIISPRPRPAQPPQIQAQTPKAVQPTVKPVPRQSVTVVRPVERARPVGFDRKIVSPNRAVSLTENRRTRAQAEHLEQYRAGIMRLKDIGFGKILIILANGPSVNEVAVDELNNKPNIDIMCVNKPNQKVWPTKYWSFCDQSQYSRNAGAWDSYNGTVINATAVRARRSNQVLIKNISGTGFSKDMTRGYYIGRSTTYASMQLALWMNYDKVYIFGCDMCAVNGKLHSYGKNPDVSDEHRLERFKQEAESYTYAAQNLSGEERQRFVFCSNYNKFKFLDSFPRMDHLQAVQLILESAKGK